MSIIMTMTVIHSQKGFIDLNAKQMQIYHNKQRPVRFCFVDMTQRDSELKVNNKQ